MSMLKMRGTSTGARLWDIPGWPGWTVEVDIDWRAGRAKDGKDNVRAIAPPGTRRNARRPTDDADLVELLKQAADMRHGFVGFVAAALPTPKRKHNPARRGQIIATVYRAAKEQGFSPRRAISAVYGLPVIDEPGQRTIYHNKLERWIKQARNTKDTNGQPFLPTYDKERDDPRRWPGSTGRHPLEPRRARPWSDEFKPVKGPYSGRTLTLYVRPAEPFGMNAAGDEIADVEIVGTWSDGTTLKDIEFLRAVTLAETVTHHLAKLMAKHKHEYPGARIRAVFGNPGSTS